MSAQPLAQHIFDVEKRRAARDAVSIRAALHEPGEDGHEILVGNLSPFGFMAISPKAYREGTLVRLDLPLIGEVNARIVWSLSDRIGAEFIRPFDARGYRQLLDSTPHKAQNDED
ncbi:PilZ domain-containing protein [Parasphingopyxis sp.]|uniref:PilZ domain-containing protein n=1 Tax=Parasphingopyxis sp. TaxID=1920299 RepID=UPI002606CE21|nr:PilZ domain-containing protein [Parasphingopyxis sp.]